MCKTLVFHFNKAHLVDQSIPPWVIKFDGQTEYVHHAEFVGCSFSTKETPDNQSTKGSLKFRNVKLTLSAVGDEIQANITQLPRESVS